MKNETEAVQALATQIIAEQKRQHYLKCVGECQALLDRMHKQTSMQQCMEELQAKINGSHKG